MVVRLVDLSFLKDLKGIICRIYIQICSLKTSCSFVPLVKEHRTKLASVLMSPVKIKCLRHMNWLSYFLNSLAEYYSSLVLILKKNYQEKLKVEKFRCFAVFLIFNNNNKRNDLGLILLYFEETNIWGNTYLQNRWIR